MARRLAAAVLALVVVVASAYAALIGIVFGFGLKCDESCSEGGGWRDNPGAWQWDVLGWSGLGAFFAACALLAAAALGRRELGSLALAAWGVCAVVFGILLVGGESPDEVVVTAVLVVLAAAGAGALLLAPSRKSA